MLVLTAPESGPSWTGLMLALTQPILRVKMGPKDGTSDPAHQPARLINTSGITSDSTPYLAHQISVPDGTPDVTSDPVHQISRQIARQDGTPDNTADSAHQIAHPIAHLIQHTDPARRIHQIHHTQIARLIMVPGSHGRIQRSRSHRHITHLIQHVGSIVPYGTPDGIQIQRSRSHRQI